MCHAVFGMVCALVIGIFAGSLNRASPWNRKVRVRKIPAIIVSAGFSRRATQHENRSATRLAQLADPYDPAVNAAYVEQVNDISYYKGKIYLYFGVTPALVLFWPYASLTGHYLSDKDAVVIFLRWAS